MNPHILNVNCYTCYSKMLIPVRNLSNDLTFFLGQINGNYERRIIELIHVLKWRL